MVSIARIAHCFNRAASESTREEVHAAMEDLTRSGEAIRIPDRDGIIIRRGL